MTEPTDLIARLRKAFTGWQHIPILLEAADLLASVTAERDEARRHGDPHHWMDRIYEILGVPTISSRPLPEYVRDAVAELTRLREALAREREECALIAERSIISTPVSVGEDACELIDATILDI